MGMTEELLLYVSSGVLFASALGYSMVRLIDPNGDPIAQALYKIIRRLLLVFLIHQVLVVARIVMLAYWNDQTEQLRYSLLVVSEAIFLLALAWVLRRLIRL